MFLEQLEQGEYPRVSHLKVFISGQKIEENCAGGLLFIFCLSRKKCNLQSRKCPLIHKGAYEIIIKLIIANILILDF